MHSRLAVVIHYLKISSGFKAVGAQNYIRPALGQFRRASAGPGIIGAVDQSASLRQPVGILEKGRFDIPIVPVIVEMIDINSCNHKLVRVKREKMATILAGLSDKKLVTTEISGPVVEAPHCRADQNSGRQLQFLHNGAGHGGSGGLSVHTGNTGCMQVPRQFAQGQGVFSDGNTSPAGLYEFGVIFRVIGSRIDHQICIAGQIFGVESLTVGNSQRSEDRIGIKPLLSIRAAYLGPVALHELGQSRHSGTLYTDKVEFGCLQIGRQNSLRNHTPILHLLMLLFNISLIFQSDY